MGLDLIRNCSDIVHNIYMFVMLYVVKDLRFYLEYLNLNYDTLNITLNISNIKMQMLII